jgi:histidine triad (HIT) family protein
MCYNNSKKKETYMCLFCKIVNKEIPSNIVLEDENFLAFHDINPKAPVHILVIPKIHVDSFNEVTPETMQSMTPFIQAVAKEMNIDESGYRVITNIGENGGQEVKHLHFHILGGAKLKWEHFSDADPKDFI